MSKYGTTMTIHGVEGVQITHTRWASDSNGTYHSAKLVVKDSDGNEFELQLYNNSEHEIPVVTTAITQHKEY